MFDQKNSNYHLSTDYDLLKELLEAGQVFGIVECNFTEGSLILDPVLIWKKGPDSYMAGVRGTGYLDAWPAAGGWAAFLEQAEKYKLQFVVPDRQLAEDLRVAKENYAACCAARAGVVRTMEMYKKDSESDAETVERQWEEINELRVQLEQCRREVKMLRE